MAEAVGLAIGVAGLAGLFSTCLDLFDVVQLGRARDRDSRLLHLKLENQFARFGLWGETIRITDLDRSELRSSLPYIRRLIERNMDHIIALFSESETFTARHGLARINDRALQSSSHNAPGNLFRRLLEPQSATQASGPSRSSGGGHNIILAVRWAVVDRQKYLCLVNDLKDLIDVLESFTNSSQTIVRRQTLVRQGLETMTGPDIRLIADADDDSASIIGTEANLLLQTPRQTQTGSAWQVDRLQADEPQAQSVEHTFDALSLRDAHQLKEFDSRSGIRPDTNSTRCPVRPRIAPRHRPYDFRCENDIFRHSFNVDYMRPPGYLENNRTFSSRVRKEILRFFEELDPLMNVSYHVIAENAMEGLGTIAGPPDTPYEGGVFFVRVTLPSDYPIGPMKMRFLTRVYHPNISETGVICADFLVEGSGWTPKLGLRSALVTLSSLLDDPDTVNPLELAVASLCLIDRDAFDLEARAWTRRYARCPRPSDEYLLSSDGTVEATTMLPGMEEEAMTLSHELADTLE